MIGVKPGEIITSLILTFFVCKIITNFVEIFKRKNEHDLVNNVTIKEVTGM